MVFSLSYQFPSHEQLRPFAGLFLLKRRRSCKGKEQIFLFVFMRCAAYKYPPPKAQHLSMLEQLTLMSNSSYPQYFIINLLL
jgi:hypothetical protein